MGGIFRGALQQISTPRAALLPIFQRLWWQVQLDQHGKGSPASLMTVCFRIREMLCFLMGDLYPGSNRVNFCKNLRVVFLNVTLH